MSRYNLRKRKDPPENLARFIEAKKRRIETEEISGDFDYNPGEHEGRKQVPRPRGEDDDIILYDEEESLGSKAHSFNIPNEEKVSLREKEEFEDKDEEREESGETSSNKSKDEEESKDEKDSSEESKDEKDSSEESDNEKFDTSFSPDIFANIVNDAVEAVEAKRSRMIDENVMKKAKEMISDEEAAQLESIANITKKKLEEEEPDIVKILQTSMTENDRKRMIQLYEIYKNTVEHTFEHYELRLKLIGMLKNLSRTPIAESEFVEKETERITDSLVRTDTHAIKRRIIGLDAEEYIKAKLLDMHRELQETPSDTAQYRNLKEKIEWAISLPFRKTSVPHCLKTPEEINEYCIQIRRTLDKELYGMDNVKDELITLRINRLDNPDSISTIALEGPAGVGKTAICSAFAKAVGKPFQRVALGGLIHPDVLKGSANEYVGSTPSIILQFLCTMGVSDGYILLDEIDKLGDTPGGLAVQNVLLHITDYTQNKEFRDTYLSEFPHDISRIVFMYGMNDRTQVNPILRDRLTIIEVEAYSHVDLCQIIKNYLLPKAVKKTSMTLDQCSISDDGCNAILDMFASYIKETGVRKIDDAVRKIVSRINVLRMTSTKNGPRIKFKFSIPHFALPIVIDKNVVISLLERPKNKSPSYIT